MVFLFFLLDILFSVLVRGKYNKKLDMIIVKDLIIVMIVEKEVICVIFYFERKRGLGNS